MGTDSLPAIFGARHFYGETGFVAGSVPATEHSVMSANIGYIYEELKKNGCYKGYSLEDYDNKKM